MNAEARAAHAAYMRDWYRKNKDKVKRWTKRYADRNPEQSREYKRVWAAKSRRENPIETKAASAKRRAQIRKLKAEAKANGCAVCGVTRGKLHFHHRDPATKLFAVGVGAGRFSINVVRREIAKCDVMCHDCHWDEHRKHPRKRPRPPLTK